MSTIERISDLKTIKELSFKVIRENFSRFIAAYQLTKDEVLAKNLSFLQRIYSQTLFFELEENGELKEEYFDFLLNEYLKKLDLKALLNCSTKEKVLEKILPIAPTLHELSCEPMYRWEEDSTFILQKLIPLSNKLKKITLPCICNDDLLKLISASCPDLLELNIEDSDGVTGNGIKALCLNPDGQVQVKCPLRLLNLSSVNMEVNDVAVLLKNIPTLEEVIYYDLPAAIQSLYLLDSDNNIVSNMKQLNIQSLEFSTYDSAIMTKRLSLCSERCPNIKKITAHILHEEHLELIGRFPNLENLSIHGKSPCKINLNSFLISSGRNMKILLLDNFVLSVSTLVENCPNLETLELKTIDYQELDKQSTSVLSRLQDLCLEGVVFMDYHCTDSVMMVLNSSPNLKTISFIYCDFSDSDIVAKLSVFSLNCNLSHMHFDFTDVGADLLHQFILNCNSIQKLSLENCENICWEDISMLHQTIEASNRQISIAYTDEHSDFSYSDYEVDYDFEDDYSDYYDGEEDEEDYDGFNNYFNIYHNFE